MTELHKELVREVAQYHQTAGDVAGTWAVLSTLHDRGCLDVSQAGNYRTLISVRPSRTAPGDVVDHTVGHRDRRNRELAELRAWYTEDRACANAGMAGYFGMSEHALPKDTCTTSACRCSTCWQHNAERAPLPDLLRAFSTPHPRPSVRRDGLPYRTVTDRNIRSLLWDNYRGLTDVMINRVLRGDETYPDASSGRQRPLWPRLLYHRLRGCDPGARIDDVRAALDRLAAAEQAVRTDDGLWRLRRYVEADELRERTTTGQAVEVST